MRSVNDLSLVDVHNSFYIGKYFIVPHFEVKLVTAISLDDFDGDITKYSFPSFKFVEIFDSHTELMIATFNSMELAINHAINLTIKVEM